MAFLEVGVAVGLGTVLEPRPCSDFVTARGGSRCSCFWTGGGRRPRRMGRGVARLGPSAFGPAWVADWPFSSLLIPAMLVPRRGLGARLAVRGIVARPRQAALLVLALVVSSSIISSSLVVGDSLDATVSRQVEAVWSETDLVLRAGTRRRHSLCR